MIHAYTNELRTKHLNKSCDNQDIQANFQQRPTTRAALRRKHMRALMWTKHKFNRQAEVVMSHRTRCEMCGVCWVCTCACVHGDGLTDRGNLQGHCVRRYLALLTEKAWGSELLTISWVAWQNDGKKQQTEPSFFTCMRDMQTSI